MAEEENVTCVTDAATRSRFAHDTMSRRAVFSVSGLMLNIVPDARRPAGAQHGMPYRLTYCRYGSVGRDVDVVRFDVCRLRGGAGDQI